MSNLLDRDPYGERDDAELLRQLNQLTAHHLAGCPELRRIWGRFEPATTLESVPFLHVGLFKQLVLRTEGKGIRHQRMLNSSATTSGTPAQIVLDTTSSALQSKSSEKIFRAVLGNEQRPLLILDSSRALRSRDVPARIAAALSLKPLASEIHFVVADDREPRELRWDALRDVLSRKDNILVYGFTSMLWQAWADNSFPQDVSKLLEQKTIDFVHSGGWKKLESANIGIDLLNTRLLQGLSPSSRVTDFYGMVEQVGLVFPVDADGFRRVPVWACCIARDPHTLESVIDEPGQLQFMNILSRGAPYHSVLTEDMGIVRNSPSGRCFRLLGRMPRAEVRGCANV
jgi:hypothetical protein